MGGRVPPPGDRSLDAILDRYPSPRRPHRPRAGILDPVGAVAALAVEAATLHQTLDATTTPQAAFDALADAHHHMVIALRLLSGRTEV